MFTSKYRAGSGTGASARISILILAGILGASQLLLPANPACAATATPVQTGGGSGGAVYHVNNPAYPTIGRPGNYKYNPGFGAGGETQGSNLGSGAAGLVSNTPDLLILSSDYIRGAHDAAIDANMPEDPSGHMGGGAGLFYSNAGGKVVVEETAVVSGGGGAYTSGGGAGMIMVYDSTTENHGSILGGSVWNNGMFTNENSGGGGAGLFMAGSDSDGTISGNSSGGALQNAGLIQGGNGGDLYRYSADGSFQPPSYRAVAGSAGNGITANNADIHNRQGAFIIGGNGGKNSSLGGESGNTPAAGDGGNGIQIYSKNAELRTVVINDGTIKGGNGGFVDGWSDHRPGMGGHGIIVYGEGTYIFNTGLIQGGESGNRASSLAGDGIRVWGDSTYIINSGHIAAGVPRHMASDPALSVNFRAKNNVLELRKGWSFDGTALSDPTDENTLALGGAAEDNVVFDQAGIKPSYVYMNQCQFRDFDFYAKVGEATWTLTGTPVNNNATPAQLLRWDVYGGTLMVDSSIAGSEVLGGVLEPANVSAQLGDVTVYGPGNGGYGFFSGRSVSGGGIALGKGGQAGFVDMQSGSSIHAYPDNVYLEAGDHFKAADDINLILRGNNWEEDTEYKLIHSANAANAIGADYAGDGVIYSTVAYEYRLYHKNFGLNDDALHLYMLSPKRDISDNPDLSDNQESTGDRVDSLLDDDMFKDIVRDMTQDEYKYASDQLSGEIYASVPTVLREQDQQLRNNVLNRSHRNHLYSMLCDQPAKYAGEAQNAATDARQASALPKELAGAASSECPAGDCPGNQNSDDICLRNDLWISLGGTYSEYSSNSNTGRTTLQGPEFAFGLDRAFGNGWGGGAFFRYGDKNMEVKSRRSELDIQSYSLGLYGSKSIAAGPGDLRFTLGGIYGYHELDGSREVRFDTINESHDVDYNAHSYTLFSEAAFLIQVADVLWVEPFVNFSYTGVKTESAKEEGGETAIKAWSDTHDAVESRVGARLNLPVYEKLSFDAELAWQHNFSDTASLDIGFIRGGNSYSIKGTSISSDALAVGLGAKVQVSKSVDISINYGGSFGDSSRHHAGQAVLTVRF